MGIISYALVIISKFIASEKNRASIFSFLILNSFSCFFLTGAENIVPVAAVTMAKGDRFGDCLWNYLNAQWIAHLTKFQFLYKPFRYSNELVLHDHDTMLTEELEKQYAMHISLGKFPYPPSIKEIRSLAQKHYTASTLYIPDFFRYGHEELGRDHSFLQKMRLFIAPNKPLELIVPPENCASIALHIRTGYGYDSEKERRIRPTRFPQLTFYAKAINDAMRLIQARPLLIHVFTDHPQPELPIRKIQKALFALQSGATLKDAHSLIWQWRTEGNRQDKNVLVDFFSLCNFDCLIRPFSHFSNCAEIIADHALIITIHKNSEKSRITYRILPNINSKRYEKLRMRCRQHKEELAGAHLINTHQKRYLKKSKWRNRPKRAGNKNQ